MTCAEFPKVIRETSRGEPVDSILSLLPTHLVDTLSRIQESKKEKLNGFPFPLLGVGDGPEVVLVASRLQVPCVALAFVPNAEREWRFQ